MPMNFFGNLAKKYIQKNDNKEEQPDSSQPKDVEELQKKIDELTVFVSAETKHRTLQI
jgi:hypothetical protein